MSLVTRVPFSPAALERAKAEVDAMLERRLAKHGPGEYASPHETLGILIEELDELRIAVRENDEAAVRRELCDIAVGCLFGMTSHDPAHHG